MLLKGDFDGSDEEEDNFFDLSSHDEIPLVQLPKNSSGKSHEGAITEKIIGLNRDIGGFKTALVSPTSNYFSGPESDGTTGSSWKQGRPRYIFQGKRIVRSKEKQKSGNRSEIAKKIDDLFSYNVNSLASFYKKHETRRELDSMREKEPGTDGHGRLGSHTDRTKFESKEVKRVSCLSETSKGNSKPKEKPILEELEGEEGTLEEPKKEKKAFARIWKEMEERPVTGAGQFKNFEELLERKLADEKQGIFGEYGNNWKNGAKSEENKALDPKENEEDKKKTETAIGEEPTEKKSPFEFLRKGQKVSPKVQKNERRGQTEPSKNQFENGKNGKEENLSSKKIEKDEAVKPEELIAKRFLEEKRSLLQKAKEELIRESDAKIKSEEQENNLKQGLKEKEKELKEIQKEKNDLERQISEEIGKIKQEKDKLESKEKDLANNEKEEKNKSLMVQKLREENQKLENLIDFLKKEENEKAEELQKAMEAKSKAQETIKAKEKIDDTQKRLSPKKLENKKTQGKEGLNGDKAEGLKKPSLIGDKDKGHMETSPEKKRIKIADNGYLSMMKRKDFPSEMPKSGQMRSVSTTGNKIKGTNGYSSRKKDEEEALMQKREARRQEILQEKKKDIVQRRINFNEIRKSYEDQKKSIKKEKSTETKEILKKKPDEKTLKDQENPKKQEPSSNLEENETEKLKDRVRRRRDEFAFDKNQYYLECFGDGQKIKSIKKESIRKDGKKQILYENGDKETIFVNGVKKIVAPNGYTIVHFANKDIKQTFPDGTVVYYFAEAATTQTTLLNPQINTSFCWEKQIYRFSNNQTEFHYPDGSKDIMVLKNRFADGVEKKVNKKHYEKNSKDPLNTEQNSKKPQEESMERPNPKDKGMSGQTQSRSKSTNASQENPSEKNSVKNTRQRPLFKD